MYFKVNDKIRLNTEYNEKLGHYSWWYEWIDKTLTIKIIDDENNRVFFNENGYVYHFNWIQKEFEPIEFIKEEEFSV